MIDHLSQNLIAISAAVAQDAPVNEFGYTHYVSPTEPIENLLIMLALAFPIVLGIVMLVFRMPKPGRD